MNRIIRNSAAILSGLIIGSIVNMGLINVSGSVIPPPKGVDVTNFEGLKASMHLFENKHFIFPFLAHALGTLVGAMFAYSIAFNHKIKFALIIGFLFFIGGLINILMLPSPTWFTIVDLSLAYFPMAFLGGKLASVIFKT